MERIAEKLRKLGCTYFVSEVGGSGGEWAEQLLLQPSQERSEVLGWLVRLAEPGTAQAPTELLTTTGLASQQEAAAFISGSLAAGQQAKMWELLADLAQPVQANSSDAAREEYNRNAELIDALAENVRFDKVDLKLTPFHFEKEIAQVNTKSKKVIIPSNIEIEAKYESILREKCLLEQTVGEVCETEMESEMAFLNRLSQAAGEVLVKKTEVMQKYKCELEPWLGGSGEGKAECKDRSEIGETVETLELLAEHLSNKVTITNCSHQLKSSFEQVAAVLTTVAAENNSLLEFESLDSTMHQLSMSASRAPAAS